MERTNEQRSGDFGIASLCDITALNIQRFVHQSPDVAWDTITSHLISVVRHPAVPQPIRLQPTRTLGDILVAMLPRLTPPHRRCSSAFSTSSRSRLCLAPRRVLTWTYVAWPWRPYTRSFRRRVLPYLSDSTLSSDSDVLGPRLPTPLRISFRLSPGRLADARRRSGTYGRRAILR